MNRREREQQNAVRPRGCPPQKRAAFTLVELLVAMTVVTLILLLTVEMTNNVSALSNRTRARVETFQESRAAFESMTRKISQSMLNTYWDYDYPGGNTASAPSAYARQSQLHFICGPAKNGDSSGQLLKSVATLQTTTHALFFQAPQGYSAPPSSSTQPKIAPNLASLLNASGYYIDYASDKNDRPNFLKASSGGNVPPERLRFRLMELEEPTESLQIYGDGTPTGASVATLRKWFLDPVTFSSTQPLPANTPLSTRVLAENVFALVLLPHRSPNDKLPANLTAPQQLAPAYVYDSRKYLNSPADPQAKLWRNQLPPIIQVTMVAMDERSAARFQDSLPSATSIPETTLGLDGLFTKPSTDPNVSVTSTTVNDQYFADLATLEATLVKLKITYRIFTSDVSILQAKWSDN